MLAVTVAAPHRGTDNRDAQQRAELTGRAGSRKQSMWAQKRERLAGPGPARPASIAVANDRCRRGTLGHTSWVHAE